MAEAGLERLLLGCLLLPGIAVLLYFVVTRPGIRNTALVIAIFGAIAASVSWAVKEIAASYHRRAQLLILEFLSDGKRHNRSEIAQKLRKQGLVFRVTTMHEDALSLLVSTKLIDVEDGGYRLSDAHERTPD